MRVKDSIKEPIVLLANKLDLEGKFSIHFAYIISEAREVTTAEGQKLAEQLETGFFETSAKTK